MQGFESTAVSHHRLSSGSFSHEISGGRISPEPSCGPSSMATRRCLRRTGVLLSVALVALSSSMPQFARGFVPSSVPFRIASQRTIPQLARPAPPLAMALVADEKEELHLNKNKKDDDDDSAYHSRSTSNNNRYNDNNYDAWIPTVGGYLPNLKKFKPEFSTSRRASPATPSTSITTTEPLLTEVTTIQDYKRIVADERDKIVVVRFYAPWCRACRAIAAPFRKLAQDMTGGNNSQIKFVEVPLTPDNAYLHQGLGVNSLPYGHIYHPAAGLVEEQSLNKKYFNAFRDKVHTYVNGQCDIDWDQLP